MMPMGWSCDCVVLDEPGSFVCGRCLQTVGAENGCDDAFERAFATGEDGICDDCVSKIPRRLIEWVEAADRCFAEAKAQR